MTVYRLKVNLHRSKGKETERSLLLLSQRKMKEN